jgi:hypothetical protein
MPNASWWQLWPAFPAVRECGVSSVDIAMTVRGNWLKRMGRAQEND